MKHLILFSVFSSPFTDFFFLIQYLFLIVKENDDNVYSA